MKLGIAAVIILIMAIWWFGLFLIIQAAICRKEYGHNPDGNVIRKLAQFVNWLKR